MFDDDQSLGSLAGLILYIIRARPEAVRPFEDAPDALRVLRVLAGEDEAGSPGPGQPG